ncbi:MAG: methylenetetrahydrofolate reductase [NAD(P)H] [Firmicutes bacterium]|nr:methylenetetrahydrofolate reductase [NAD(P)H] [Bacillota bacterium]
MLIKSLYQQKTPVLSFEIFPPKPEYPLDTVFKTIEGIRDLNPDFISVTYGAGGSNRSRTIEIASRIKKTYGIETLAHLTCVGHSPEELDQIVNQMKDEGIENILALRGDPPRDRPEITFRPGNYRYAIELVKHLRRYSGFCVGAAAYAEGHIESKRWRDDWEHLRAKVEAGVDFLVTQLFFDNRIFYNFKENMLRMGVTAPVSAGIMPVLNPNRIKKMIYLSGASLPAKLLQLLDQYGDQPVEFEKFGIDYAVNQINELLENGVEGIHLYTMNRAQQTRIIVKNLNLVGRNK